MKNKGITLIALIITIIILIILASISISIIRGKNGLLNKAQTASDETKKSQATETMNLKITNIQISSYAETQELPNLQYLADKLCEDNDMEYVLTASKEHASLDKIDVTNLSSIYTKLKKYPYEFEINSSLQLASIDGIKIADNNDDGTVTLTQSQYNSILSRLTALENNSNNTNTNENYSTEEQIIGTWINGKKIYQKIITTETPTVVTNGTYVEELIDVSSLDIDCMINIEKKFDFTSTINQIYYGIAQTNSGNHLKVIYKPNDNNILIVNGASAFNNGSVQIILKYTKIM